MLKLLRSFVVGVGFLLGASSALAQSGDTTEVRRLTDVARKLRENHPDSMLHYLEQGFRLADEIKDARGSIDLFILRGAYYWTVNNYVPAIEDYNHAMQLSRTSGWRTGVHKSLINLGQVYSRLGEYPRAIEFYLRAIALGDSIHADNSAVFNSLGIIYRKNHNFEQAIEATLKSISIIGARGGSDVVGALAGAYTNLGNIYMNLNDLGSAMRYQKQALRLFDSLHQTRGIIVCYNNLSQNLTKQNKFDEALVYSQQALALSQKFKFASSEALSWEGLAFIASSQGYHDKAVEYLSRAIMLGEQLKHRDDLISFYSSIAQSYESLQQHNHALQATKKLVALKDSVFNQEANNKIANLRVAYEINKRENDSILFKKDKEIALLNRNIIISIIAGLAIILFVFALHQYSKIRKNKLLLSQLDIIHTTRQRLLVADLENQKLKQAELEKEIEHKARELTTHALVLLQKNQLLDEIKDGLAGLTGNDPDLKQNIRKLSGSINLTQHQDKEWEIFKAHFNEVHSSFFENLAIAYPDLSGNDMKICSLVKLNLGLKEIASILGISPESVKVARYRLRKKIKLDQGQNLVSFLAGFN